MVFLKQDDFYIDLSEIEAFGIDLIASAVYLYSKYDKYIYGIKQTVNKEVQERFKAVLANDLANLIRATKVHIMRGNKKDMLPTVYDFDRFVEEVLRVIKTKEAQK